MEPIPFEGPPEAAIERLAAIIEGMSGGTVVDRDAKHLKAEFRSRFLGFIDDVDLVVDPAAGEIHFRSRSRKGYWDLGVNRRRMERVRSAFAGE